MPQPKTHSLLQAPPPSIRGQVVLSYDERLLRRKRLMTTEGLGFLVDLPSVTNLDDYWGFELADGSGIEVVAAVEELIEVRGPELLRYGWHIGNRHTPCQIDADRLLIRLDHVLEKMLQGLGAGLTRVAEPFRPEGGAYGHGRTFGHSHGPEAEHSHGPGGHQFAEDRAEIAAAAAPAPPLKPAKHVHGAGYGCGPSHSTEPAPQPAYLAWAPEAEPAEFGWHHHGDGKLHYHAPPRRPQPDEPALAPLLPGRTEE